MKQTIAHSQPATSTTRDNMASITSNAPSEEQRSLVKEIYTRLDVTKFTEENLQRVYAIKAEPATEESFNTLLEIGLVEVRRTILRKEEEMSSASQYGR